MSQPAVATSVPVRSSDRAVPEIVLEAGYQRGLEVAGLELLPVSPVDRGDAAVRKLQRAAGLLLTGGEDVDPRRYGEEPRAAREVSLERDDLEFGLLHEALDRGIPVLGICRGMQVLSVGLGGALYQDLRDDRPAEIRVDHDRRYSVDKPAHDIHVEGPELLEGVFRASTFHPNSSHHQAVRQLPSSLEPVCRAEDGVVEAVELRDGGRWVAGVQWHPERMLEEGSETHMRLFRTFGDVVRGHGG